VTRIVAGVLGGRRLQTPPGRGTRPSSERVREALFAALEAMTEVNGCRFADLYAGSGAVGLEAASRGAAAVLFVEADPRAARVVRANIAALDLAERCRVQVARLPGALAAGPEGEPYDVVFADPPYEVPNEEIGELLRGLVAYGWLADGAVVVVERSVRSGPPPTVEEITLHRSRRYGESVLWYLAHGPT
jgi:16S rRNA (guanine966-N2)-methyltransferase